VSILSFPVELTEMVFVHYARDAVNAVFVSCSVPNPAVSQVCAYWRAIALKVPHLWNRIHLAQPRFLVAVLERSNFLISIFWGVRFIHMDWIKKTSKTLTIPRAAISKLGRIRMIDFTTSPDNRLENTRKLFTVLPLEMPELRAVRVTSESQTLQRWFSKVRAPNLQKINLVGVHVDWTVPALRFGGQLVRLEVDMDPFPRYEAPPQPPPVSRLLALLPNLTLLRQLMVFDHAVTFDTAPADVERDVIILPKLQYLRVHGLTDHCIVLLRAIRPGKLDDFTLHASAVSYSSYDVVRRNSYFGPLQMRYLWNAAHSSLASLDSDSRLSVELHLQAGRTTRYDSATRATVRVDFDGIDAYFPDVLDLPFIHRNISSLEIKCIGSRAVDFPPSEGEEDLDSPESDFILGEPSILGWARFVETATHITELTLAGDIALKVLLNLALDRYAAPDLPNTHHSLPPSLQSIVSLEFYDMHGPDAMDMIKAIVRNLYKLSKTLHDVLLYSCMPREQYAAFKETWQEEMPRVTLFCLP
jgi:hypothetical protein